MLVLLGGLYNILQVPYRDRRLGEPMAGVRRPIRGPLGCRGMGLEEFYTAQRQILIEPNTVRKKKIAAYAIDFTWMSPSTSCYHSY